MSMVCYAHNSSDTTLEAELHRSKGQEGPSQVQECHSAAAPAQDPRTRCENTAVDAFGSPIDG